jgi:hypothetical protein
VVIVTLRLITSSRAFREAAALRRCAPTTAVKKLASILAHEESHVRHGPDERRAYGARLRTLHRLGVPPDSSLYVGVQRAPSIALDPRTSRPERVIAAAR